MKSYWCYCSRKISFFSCSNGNAHVTISDCYKLCPKNVTALSRYNCDTHDYELSFHFYGRPALQMRILYFCPVVSIFYLFLFLA